MQEGQGKVKQSDRHSGKGSKKLLVWFSQGLRQGFFSEKLRLSQYKVIGWEAKRNIKVNSKQSDRQVGQPSRHLLKQFSQG
ncbi:hypothetical protein M0802_016513 [Mischocyttarus mexicanus]|nr:hypothetical protein M0802_016513 [Mischocyttarus mexicanus]